MKTKHMSALVRDDITTISVSFTPRERDEEDEQRVIKRAPNHAPRNPTGCYTFKCLKEDAAKLTPGSIVIVDTAHGFKFGNLVEVHDEPQIDPDFDGDYRWFVSILPLDRYHQILKHEQALDKACLDAERAVKRRGIVEQFREALGGKLPTAFALAAPVPPATAFREGGE